MIWSLGLPFLCHAYRSKSPVDLYFGISVRLFRGMKNGTMHTDTTGRRNSLAVYYKDENILIRTILPADAQIICDEEIAQGWNQTIDKYLMRIKDNSTGKSIALVAEYQGNVAGYINIYPDSKWGAFANKGYPEIVDFGVLEKYRRNGIGAKLMDVAEEIAGKYADTVYLGVGLNSGYGSAQRMYVKRGFVPDGSGVWYGEKVAVPYKEYCNDDDLILYLSKKL